MNQPMFDRVWTRKEAAKILGCSVRTLQTLESKGELQPVYVTPRIVGYRDSHLRRYLHERTGGKANHKPSIAFAGKFRDCHGILIGAFAGALNSNQFRTCQAVPSGTALFVVESACRRESVRAA